MAWQIGDECTVQPDNDIARHKSSQRFFGEPCEVIGLQPEYELIVVRLLYDHDVRDAFPWYNIVPFVDDPIIGRFL